MTNISNGDFVWLMIITGSQIVNLIATLYSFRRSPPISEELYKDFVTKKDLLENCKKHYEEVQSFREHNTEVHSEMFKQIDQLQKAWSEDLKTLERAIGRLEGIISVVHKKQ